MSHDETLCQQVWAVWAMQNGRPDLAGRYMRIPKEAVGAALGQANHIPPWILEALVNERFALPPFTPQPRPGGVERTLRGDTFAAILQATLWLREAEEGAQAVALERLDVMRELPRLLQRQLEWGRGWLNGPQTYRWAFLYGGKATREWFLDRYGLSIPDFMLFGVLLFSLFRTSPAGPPDFGFDEVGLDRETCEAAMRRLVLPSDQARDALRRQREGFRGALYKPSLLRGAPVLAFGAGGERLRAPLPDLILLRTTAGLFYDLASAPDHIRNEAGERFEIYARDLLNAALPGFTSVKGEAYASRKRPVNAPDVMVRDGDSLVAVIECKARKMTFAARYGAAPEAEVAVKELVKGVFQLWRHFAHDRMGLTPGPKADADTVAVLLTLENWTQMNKQLQLHILREAEAMCASEPAILAEDRRPVVFASIEELEATLERGDETGFRNALREAATERFTGWMLPSVFREVETGVPRPYPMASRMAEVLPWWALVDDDGDQGEPSVVA